MTRDAARTSEEGRKPRFSMRPKMSMASSTCSSSSSIVIMMVVAVVILERQRRTKVERSGRMHTQQTPSHTQSVDHPSSPSSPSSHVYIHSTRTHLVAVEEDVDRLLVVLRHGRRRPGRACVTRVCTYTQ